MQGYYQSLRKDSIKLRKKILSSYCHLNLIRRNRIPKLIPIGFYVINEILNLFSHYNIYLMNPKPDDNDDDVDVIDFDEIISFDDYDNSTEN